MSTETVAPNGGDVLVVDDDPRNRRLLEGYLLSEGYEVRLAENGNEALGEAFRKAPDLVLLDVMMPGLNGFEVCGTLKSNPDTRLTQVMLVTALDGTPHRVEGLDGGADDYVSKPVRREEFMAKVRSLLRARSLLMELEDARGILAERNAQLEELEALKETLIQTLVHDLKNPLAVIMGNLDLMARTIDDSNARQIRRSRANAERMHRMILDLLDVAGLEEGRFALKPEPVDTAALTREAIEEAGVSAETRGVSLEMDTSQDGCTVHGDNSVLRRVVDNLLANALEHAPSGTTVRAGVAHRDEGIEISLADQGTGIPPEHRDRIFEKYARLELKNSGVSANRGLGLTFCRLAVEAHGGTIWVEEAPGGGALFRVLLPASEPSGAEDDGVALSF
jgi:two-component system sensor histidine kinase/response regulator